MQADESDHDMAVASPSELKVGRILSNGGPTGLEAGYAMALGGNYPATAVPGTS